MPSVIGIDLSTQSCTVEVRDADSFLVTARSRIGLSPTSPPNSEQDALTWWAALVEASHELSVFSRLDDVAAIGVSGQCHGLVPLDSENEPVRTVKLWNDTTSAVQIADLVERFGEQFWVDHVGSVPTAAFTIAKLAWLIENEAQNVAKVRHIVLPHDYLTFRLTGAFATDRSEASGTGYFNSRIDRYDYDLLRACFGDVLPWERVFPEVRGPQDLAGYLSIQAANELGLTPGIPVTIGGGDQHVAALGLGIADGDVVFSLGTSGVVYTSSATPVAARRVDGVANATGGWLPLVCTLNSTKVTDWTARLLGVTVQELDSLAEIALAKDRPVPVFAPYLDGERSPAYPGVTGVLAGLTNATGREEFALSAYLGVAMGLVRGLEEIQKAEVRTDGQYVAVGGGARSGVYNKVLADLTGHPIEAIDEPEATARGACVQAVAAITGEPVMAASARLRPKVSRTTVPSGPALWPQARDSYFAVCDFASTTASLRD